MAAALVREGQRESREDLFCFTSNHPIGGNDKKCEVLMLHETGIKILPLLFAFMLGNDYVGVLTMVGFVIRVCDVDIHNDVSAVGIKSTEEKVAMLAVAVASGIWVGDLLNWWLVVRRGLGLIGCGAFDLKGSARTADGVVVLVAKLPTSLSLTSLYRRIMRPLTLNSSAR
jgi:hypothetical protein